MKKLLFILILSFSLQLFSQEANYRQLVAEYLEVNGTTEQYEKAIDGLFDLLKRQYNDQGVNDATWSSLREDTAPALGQIKAMLVSAYRGTYEKEDISNMLKFYKSPTGKQVLFNQTTMTEDQKVKAAQFYNSPTGIKVLDSQQEIAKRVSEVSEIWSRDLYRSVTDKLAEKGYVLNR